MFFHIIGMLSRIKLLVLLHVSNLSFIKISTDKVIKIKQNMTVVMSMNNVPQQVISKKKG